MGAGVAHNLHNISGGLGQEQRIGLAGIQASIALIGQELDRVANNLDIGQQML
jgi:hypothetical protein